MSDSAKKTISSLKNHFLLAMPRLSDPNFSQSVVYICEHSVDGAMGLIINHQLDIPVKAIFDQLELQYDDQYGNSLIFDGGPVQRDRGFILHRSCERQWESTLTIADDGPGIADDALKQIFEPFFTTKPIGQGTGLGLSISHDIIQHHGGTMTVESQLGAGTTFTIRLPLKQTDRADAA